MADKQTEIRVDSYKDKASEPCQLSVKTTNFNPKKFLSRKFLISIVGIVVGIAIAFGAEASEIMQIAGAITSAVSAVSYIFGEAIIDAAAVKNTEVEALPTIVEDEDEEL